MSFQPKRKAGSSPVVPPPAPAQGLPVTDKQRAERFHEWLDGDFRYLYSWKTWAYWDGTGWKIDPSGTMGVSIKHKAFEFSEVMMEEARTIPPGTQQTQAIAIAQKLQSMDVVNTMVAALMTLDGVTARPDDFDTDPFLLSVQNGVIDLKTGLFREKTKEDMMLKTAGVAYTADAKCPMWEEFLGQVQPDTSVVDYLQRVAGYSLTGDTREQIMFFMHGMGQNGKNTYVDTLSRLWGEYAWTTSATLFLETKGDDNKMNMLSVLPERRLVVGEEMPDGAHLAESRIKDMTGNQTIQARKLFCEPFNFSPTHKLLFFGNHKPVVKGNDKGIWRRLHLIPFDVTIPDDKRDRNILNRLWTEAPGILNWALAGCAKWQADGLGTPQIVRAATEEYREEEDTMQHFFDEHCKFGPECEIRRDGLALAYLEWLKSIGVKFTPHPRVVTARVKKMPGVAETKRHGLRFWRGLTLKDPKAFVGVKT